MDLNTPSHIVLSGGSRGLGQAIAAGLLDAGYAISTLSLHASEFTEKLKDHPRFLPIVGDITDAGRVSEAVASGTRRFGRPYGLVNCAGIAAVSVLAMMPPEQIDRMLAINLGGMLHLTRLVAQKMLVDRAGGCIVNISSAVALRGCSGLAAYAATKGGIDAATRALSRELGPRGIRVNSIAPGFMETDMTRGLSAQQKEQIIRQTPLGRLATPADIVGPVLFLLSDAGRFISGQVIAVDGGLTA